MSKSNIKYNYKLFESILRSLSRFPLVTEHRFHDVKRWRFDYAYPDLKIAIEIEGGVFTNGAHVRGKGYIKDMEKYTEASILEWMILRFTPKQLKTRKTLDTIQRAIEKRKPRRN